MFFTHYILLTKKKKVTRRKLWLGSSSLRDRTGICIFSWLSCSCWIKLIVIPGSATVPSMEYLFVSEERIVTMTTTTLQRPSKRRRSQNLPDEDVTICPICLDPILDVTENSVGQEAIFCESTCNSWIHRQCAGLSQVLFNLFEESEEPFYCPHCRLVS